MQLLLERGDRLLDDDVVLQTRSLPPQTIRLMVPGALPSMRISRGWTTVASATAGLVTAIRVTSNVGRHDGRASGRDRDLRELTSAVAAARRVRPPPAACNSRERRTTLLRHLTTSALRFAARIASTV